MGLLEFSSYYQVDVTNYENTIGLSKYVSLTNVVIGRHAPSPANNIEVAVDIEMAIAMASGLSRVIVYEISSGRFQTTRKRRSRSSSRWCRRRW